MSIVYSHSRKDTGEVFYIGIGVDQRRSRSLQNRNKFWHNIVNKSGYLIRILYDGLTRKEASDIEEKLILQYGRRDLGTGTLVNVTKGGEGVRGRKWSHSQRSKLSGCNSVHFGKKQSSIIISMKSGNNSPHYGKRGNNHPAHYQVFTDERRKGISKRMLGNKSAKGAVRKEHEKDRLREVMLGNKNSLGYEFTENQKLNLAKGHFKKIIQYDMGHNYIKEWQSVKEAGNTLSLNRPSISMCLKGKHKSCGGFLWEYASLAGQTVELPDI